MKCSEIQNRLGENLKTIRKEHKLTQFQLAERADVSEETIKNVELSRAWPSEKTLSQISDALQIDVYQLFKPLAASFKMETDMQNYLQKTIANSYESYVASMLKKITK